MENAYKRTRLKCRTNRHIAIFFFSSTASIVRYIGFITENMLFVYMVSGDTIRLEMG